MELSPTLRAFLDSASSRIAGKQAGSKARRDETAKVGALLARTSAVEILGRQVPAALASEGLLDGDETLRACAAEVLTLAKEVSDAITAFPDRADGTKAGAGASASILAAAGMALYAAEHASDPAMFRPAVDAAWRELGRADEQVNAAQAAGQNGANGGSRNARTPSKALEAALKDGSAKGSIIEQASTYGMAPRNVSTIRKKAKR